MFQESLFQNVTVEVKTQRTQFEKESTLSSFLLVHFLYPGHYHHISVNSEPKKDVLSRLGPKRP